MTRENLFKNEIESISNVNFRKFLIEIINNADEYFFSTPASTSGKYHPQHSLGVGGLLRHSKQVYALTCYMCELKQYSLTSDEKDLLKIAAISHDIKKLGDGKRGHTVKEHPKIAVDYITEINNKHNLLSPVELQFVCNAVESHMGEWGDKLPQTHGERIICIADYLSSRKTIGFTFDEGDLNNTMLGSFSVGDVSGDSSSQPIETTKNNIITEASEYIFPFGKHKGTKISEIPTSYLEWCVENISNQMVVSEIKKFMAKS